MRVSVPVLSLGIVSLTLWLKAVPQSAQRSGTGEKPAYRSIAHEALALEGEHLPVRPASRKLLDDILDAAFAARAALPVGVDKLPPREQALVILKMIDGVLQKFHFVYPATGGVQTLRDGLADVNLDVNGIAGLLKQEENSERLDMIVRSRKETFHIADCDIFSILYTAIGEALGVPVSCVNLPGDATESGHFYVVYALSGGGQVAWEATSGTERDADEDGLSFKDAPRTLEQARAARSYGISMTRKETLAFWHTLVASDWERCGAFEKAAASYREAARLDPNNAEARNSAAWLFATCPDPAVRNPAEALTLCSKLEEIWPGAPEIDTLAAAYAANGMWDEAVRTQKRAVKLAASDSPEAPDFELRRKMYTKKQTWLDPRFDEQPDDDGDQAEK